MVSVVIPCYNQAHFLAEAIGSIRAQTTGGDAEIIVVDDGSTDETAAVAAQLGVQCVRQHNQGQGAARNLGLRHATREFVVFLDADDRLLPHAFSVGLRLLAAHPSCVFTAGRCIVFGAEGVRTDTRYEPVVERDHYLQLLRSNFIWMPGTVMFRTAIVRRFGGFKTTVTGAEDYDLYLRIAREHRIWCHGEFVAEYRQHGSSTSRRPRLMLRSTLNVMEGQRASVRGNARAEAAWRDGVRHWQQEYGEEVVRAMRLQVRAGDWRGTVPALATMLRYHPRGLLLHASRKLSRVARGEKPEPLEH
jgi:glycosyltransferase involved in cell wall biosynthesis